MKTGSGHIDNSRIATFFDPLVGVHCSGPRIIEKSLGFTRRSATWRAHCWCNRVSPIYAVATCPVPLFKNSMNDNFP